MSKKLVVTFPGGIGIEIPLLYFASKHFEDLGYERVFINRPNSDENSFEDLLANAEKIISSIDFSEYEDVIFIAKSIGTLIACKIKESYKISASLILFTPQEETLKYITSENDILLVAMGNKDEYLSSEKLSELCENEKINLYIESGVGHRMEVMNDLRRNLEIVYNVISKIKYIQ